MSKFSTSIPIQNLLDELKEKLPKGSSIISHKLDGDRVSVEWENPNLVTNYLQATPFPESSLMGELPDGVRVKTAAPPPPLESEHVDNHRRKGKKGK